VQQRLSTYAYGDDGRAILTTKGEPAQRRDGKVVAGTGIEQLQVAYVDKPLPGDGPADASGAVHPRHLGKTIITNGLGQKSELLSAIIGNHYRLVEFAGPGCATCGTANMRYDYNAAGQLLRAIQIDAQRKPVSATVFQYDVHGRSVREGHQEFSAAKPQPVQWRRRLEYHDVSYPDGSVALGWRPSLVAEPSVVAGRERVLHYSYNDLGQMTQVSESGFSPVDEQGRLVAPGVSISRVTSYRYKAVGSRSLLAEIDGPLPNGPTASPADSDIVRIDYDAEGNFVSGWTTPGGARFTAGEFDAAGRPHSLTSDDGAHPVSLRLAFLPTGQIERLTYTAGKGPKPEQRVVRYEYDALGRRVLQTGPDGVALRSLHDIAGHLTHQILPDGSQQVDAYDLDGHRSETAMYGPGGTAGMVRHYDFQGDRATGFIEQAIAPARGASGALSDVFARQAVTQSPGLLSDRLVRADGSVATRRRDDFDRVVQVTMPGRGPDSARYDEAGRVVQWRTGAGVTTSITRDPAGRPLEVSAATRDGQQERTTYRYLGAALTQEIHWIGAREDSRLDWQIDRWGEQVGKRLLVAAADAAARPVALALQRQTDSAGRPLRETLPSGAVVTYDYDTSGRVRGIALDGHRLVGGVVHEASRGGMAVTGYVQGDGLIHARELDADRRLRALQDGPQRRTFALDDEGHIRHVERSQPAAAGTPAASAPTSASVEDYGYDAPGRLTWEQLDGRRSATLAYTPLGERTGASRSTDGAGQVLQRGPQRLAYNAQGQVASVHQPDGTEVASYRYDGDGVRVAKRVQGRDTLFLYDDDDRLVAEARSDGAVVAEYVYLDGKPIARLTPRAGAPVAVAYLRTDQRGGVEGMATPEGHVTWAARLDAFGSPHMQVGNAQDMPLRLPGQYADEETGLYYNVHRYYDPQRGEYLQPDPAGPAAGTSAYAYVASDPLGASDPRGLTLEPDPEAGGFNPAFFGTEVHTQFSNQVRALGPGWGGNDGRSGTWRGGLGGLQPDAYSVDPINLRNEAARRSFSGQLWELKPISYRADATRYASAVTQVNGYTTGATRGCWTTGSSQALVGQLSPTEVIYDGRIWDIRYVQDTPARDTSGILFYTKSPSSRILDPVTAPAPAPALSPADKARLQRSVDDVKDEGAREGWSPLTILGVVVLIGLAIAALVWLAGAAIVALVTAIIAAIGTALAEAAAGAMTLMAGLAAIFGYGPVMAAEANTEGTKEKAGLLDSVVGWFRGWF
jgi:RHS repeat-associated protein